MQVSVESIEIEIEIGIGIEIEKQVSPMRHRVRRDHCRLSVLAVNNQVEEGSFTTDHELRTTTISVFSVSSVSLWFIS